MNDIRIDASQLRGLREKLAQSPQIVQEEMLAAATEADLLLEREVKDIWPVASGVSRASIMHIERVEGLHVEGFVGSSLNYVQPVDLGTRPHFPPVDALVDWVRTKLGIAEKAARGVAFLIARKISRQGTKGAHAFDEAVPRLEQQIVRIFGDAVARIARRAGVA